MWVIMTRDNNNIQILKKFFLNILHFFGKIKYFAYFKYFLNILPIFRNYCEKKEETRFFEQLFSFQFLSTFSYFGKSLILLYPKIV